MSDPTSPNRNFRKFGPRKRDTYLQKLAEGCTLGAAAAAVGLSPDTALHYRKAHPEFEDDIERSRGKAIANVEDALYKAATTANASGAYNVGAICFFLKNRNPDNWRDMRTYEVVQKLREQERGRLFAAFEKAGITPDQADEIALVMEEWEPGANERRH